MIPLNELCARLLPSHEHLKFRALMIDEDRLILVAAMIAPRVACPKCSHLTDRIHSRYQRSLKRVCCKTLWTRAAVSSTLLGDDNTDR